MLRIYSLITHLMHNMFLGLCTPEDKKILQVKINQTAVDNQKVTDMLRRIFYLKSWLEEEDLESLLHDVKIHKEAVEQAFGILQGNIVYAVEEGSCIVKVFCPNETCHDLLYKNQLDMFKIIKNITTSYGHKHHEDVTIELESKLLKEPLGKYI